MVAAINNGGGFYRPEIYIHEAKMSGIIHNPCINKSFCKLRSMLTFTWVLCC
jgi:hypothetical protein